ncbi:hypothetical protein [Winogradskyella sp. R77965]|uniref:hypothetical protein n=1 Tax=Winogradskyella sp. R77965 TaxID=3093872 RepID=UPI0037DD4F68
MNDLQRAFIHEIGHFIAAELNYVLFGYDRRIDEFVLHFREDSKIYFDGYVRTFKLPKSNKFNLNVIANYSANIFYGCIFECLYRKINLNQCLCIISIEENLKSNIGNGSSDYYEVFERILRVEKNLKNTLDNWEEYLFSDYFNQLVLLEEQNHFLDIFNLNVNDFIENKIFDKHYINITSLRSCLDDFLSSHKKIFASFIETLKQIQNQ